MTIHQWPSPKQFYGPTDHAANTPDQTPKLPRCPRPTPRRQRCRGGRDVITANAHVCTRPFGTTPPSSIRPMRASGGARRRATGTWAESPGEVTLPSRVVERGKPRTGNDSNCPAAKNGKGRSTCTRSKNTGACFGRIEHRRGFLHRTKRLPLAIGAGRLMCQFSRVPASSPAKTCRWARSIRKRTSSPIANSSADDILETNALSPGPTRYTSTHSPSGSRT